MPRKQPQDLLALFDTLVYTCHYRLVIDAPADSAWEVVSLNEDRAALSFMDEGDPAGPDQIVENMDRATIEPAIKSIISEIRAKLTEAARIAKAAEACALAGSVAEGVFVSMDIEQLIYEADRLHDAASLLNRLSQE